MNSPDQAYKKLRLSLCVSEIKVLTARINELTPKALAGDESAARHLEASCASRRNYEEERLQLDAVLSYRARTFEIVSVSPTGRPGGYLASTKDGSVIELG